MLSSRYLASTKSLGKILEKIIGGVAPDKFTVSHLQGVGFKSSGDRSVIPVLKDLGFLTADGTPTPRYHAYRDRSKSKAVMADALREAYSDVFHISEKPAPSDRQAVQGLFKSRLNSSDRVAELQAMTFYALLSYADLDASASGAEASGGGTADASSLPEELLSGSQNGGSGADGDSGARRTLSTELHYTIQVHLPATKDIEVYNAIFRSLKENLLA